MFVGPPMPLTHITRAPQASERTSGGALHLAGRGGEIHGLKRSNPCRGETNAAPKSGPMTRPSTQSGVTVHGKFR